MPNDIKSTAFGKSGELSNSLCESIVEKQFYSVGAKVGKLSRPLIDNVKSMEARNEKPETNGEKFEKVELNSQHNKERQPSCWHSWRSTLKTR